MNVLFTKRYLISVLILIGLVIYIHYLLYYPYLDYGFSPDDWDHLIAIKVIKGGFWEKIVETWKIHGAYTSSQKIYLGILEQWLGINYSAFNFINIIWKVLATLSVYPLVFVVFRKKLLAFLTTILYAMSCSTVGTLELVVKGTEYQAIIFMNLFLITYYLMIHHAKDSIKWFILLSSSFFIGISLAPPRLFPLALLPILIEIFYSLHFKQDLKLSIKRLVVLYTPFILLLIYKPVAITGFFTGAQGVIIKIAEGNWQLALKPFDGIGFMIFWSEYWSGLIGELNVSTFGNYLFLIVSKVMIVFGILTVILSLFLAKSRKRFVVISVVLNFVVDLLIFIPISHLKEVPPELSTGFDVVSLYSTFVGIFVLTSAVSCYIEWLVSGKNNWKLAVIWISVFISYIFVFFVWLFANYLIGFRPTHQYLTIPAIGISLTAATLLVAAHEKLTSIIKVYGIEKLISYLVITLVLFPILFNINKWQVNDYLSSLLSQGTAAEQQDIQQQINSYIKKPMSIEPILMYYDFTQDRKNARFYEISIFNSLVSWSHYKDRKILNGCIGVVADDEPKLVKALKTENGKRGFSLPGYCVDTEEGTLGGTKVFFPLDNLYAFRVVDKRIVDIREELIKKLGI